MRHDFDSGVMQHIKRAGYHFKQGSSRSDDQYFTDAIYRTNQAFEGMLKEAYAVLANSNTDKTPYQIEQYFESNSVFNTRVVIAFKRYRQEWRNSSTHNHKLFFGKQDAYLAILNVSAFVFILLDQIVEHVAYKSTTALMDSRPKAARSSGKQMPLIDSLIAELKDFASTLAGHSKISTSSQLMGALSAYLMNQIPNVEVDTDLLIPSDHGDVRPDIVVSHPVSNERIVLELKSRYSKAHHDATVDQVGLYLKAASLRTGVVYYHDGRDDVMYETEVRKIGELTVYTVLPRLNRSEKAKSGKR